ncbi:LOB domain-containing protein 25-like [Abrus precatorius]|uniref:LOB domain-containing protein 25-like n=1 Tax=Abrus precatorius TaxID=3816 RepID=A0A8B8KVI8_ABRPR|nr:LOB domain-containing protein 25-like [Abrus precatorius]
MTTRSTPCGACKSLRRKCVAECLFAPHFPVENRQQFECMHHVFGSGHVASILKRVPEEARENIIKTLVYQAEARVRDPVHGCIALITEFENKLHQLQTDLEKAKKELSSYVSPHVMEAFLLNPTSILMPHSYPPVFTYSGHEMAPPFLILDPQRQDQEMKFNAVYKVVGVGGSVDTSQMQQQQGEHRVPHATHNDSGAQQQLLDQSNSKP